MITCRNCNKKKTPPLPAPTQECRNLSASAPRLFITVKYRLLMLLYRSVLGLCRHHTVPIHLLCRPYATLTPVVYNTYTSPVKPFTILNPSMYYGRGFPHRPLYNPYATYTASLCPDRHGFDDATTKVSTRPRQEGFDTRLTKKERIASWRKTVPKTNFPYSMIPVGSGQKETNCLMCAQKRKGLPRDGKRSQSEE